MISLLYFRTGPGTFSSRFPPAPFPRFSSSYATFSADCALSGNPGGKWKRGKVYDFGGYQSGRKGGPGWPGW